MKDLAGRVAILTGASRGIGVLIARQLAARGVHLALAARDAAALEALRDELVASGARAIAVPTDVSDPAALAALVAATEEQLGPVDLLVNNAGIENAAAFEVLEPSEIDRFLAVNLAGPLHLARLVLPGMLARDRGHIVNVASLAGLGPTAFGECYAATKHGLVGFTRSLRASSQASGSAVSASAVCPGFVRDVGMYHQMREDGGRAAPAILGTCSPDAVARGVVRAIERDLPDVIVNPGPMRLFFAIQATLPRFFEWVLLRIGAHGVFASTAEARGQGRRAG